MNEKNEQKGGFLSMLLGTLGESLLENILAGKEMNRAGEGFIELASDLQSKARIFNTVSSFN